jgi:hypothetical protein
MTVSVGCSALMYAFAVNAHVVGIRTDPARTVSQGATIFVVARSALSGDVCPVIIRIRKAESGCAKFKILCGVVRIEVIALAARYQR